MNRQIISSVTTYLADITTKLTNFVKNQNIRSLGQLTYRIGADQMAPNIKTPYQKPDHWNYLQYFEHMLKLNTSHAIRLQKSTQPFTLKQDLQILVTVSENKNKIVFKSLEALITDRKVYNTNFKGVFIKRTLINVKSRHNFLSTYIKQPQLKYLTSWLQVNGLETKAYLKVSSLEEFQKTGSSVSVSTSFLPGGDSIENKFIQLTKGKRKNLTKSEESDSQTDRTEFEHLVEKKSGKKKVHKDCKPVCDPNLIFGTPPIKIVTETDPPRAPQKIKEEDSQNEEVLQTPKKQRKFIRVVDAKRDVHIREDSESHKASQAPTKNSPIVSEFKILPSEQRTLSNQSKIQQNPTQESLQQLKSIVEQFKTNEKLSEMRILKILSDVSGDLTDLKTYLKTEDRSLLWKRLEDAVLRKYVKSSGQKTQMTSSKTLTVDRLYEELLKSKGEERVKRRIKYLGLQQDAKNVRN